METYSDDEDGDDLFSWGNEYVRPTDPDTSHDAADSIDFSADCYQAYAYFRRHYNPAGLTRAEFDQAVEDELMAEGFDQEQAHRRAESLRRRLSDLYDEEKNYKLLERWPDIARSKAGKIGFLRRGNQDVLFLKKKKGLEIKID